jgi:hypothetical protein
MKKYLRGQILWRPIARTLSEGWPASPMPAPRKKPSNPEDAEGHWRDTQERS